MIVRDSRVARFVSAARSLLVVQALAALLALGIAAWAFFEVRGLVAENEQLRARITELEAQQGATAIQPQPVPLGPDPTINQILPPEVLVPPEVVPIPVPEPGNSATPVTPPATEPGNDAAEQVPGRWNQQQPRTPPEVNRARPGSRPMPDRPAVQPVPDRLTPRGEPLVPQQRPPRAS